MARLLATDAASKLGDEGFPTSDWIIPPGNSRKRAMELLNQWQRDLRLQPKLEILAEKADALLNLQPMMAESSCTLSEPLASYKGERALFENELKQIIKFENFTELATYLARKKESYVHHAQGFWGQWTKRRVPWNVLADFGKAAQVLRENDGVDKNWHTLNDAIAWYVEQGWQVDTEGESLMPGMGHRRGRPFEVQKT